MVERQRNNHAIALLPLREKVARVSATDEGRCHAQTQPLIRLAAVAFARRRSTLSLKGRRATSMS
jgi:hypothetical protein